MHDSIFFCEKMGKDYNVFQPVGRFSADHSDEFIFSPFKYLESGFYIKFYIGYNKWL